MTSFAVGVRSAAAATSRLPKVSRPVQVPSRPSGLARVVEQLKLRLPG